MGTLLAWIVVVGVFELLGVHVAPVVWISILVAQLILRRVF